MKKSWIHVGLALSACLVMPLLAAEEKELPTWENVQAELKAKCPEEYAKIQETAASNLFEASNQLRKLAIDHKIQLPRPDRMGPPGMNRRGGVPGGPGMGPGRSGAPGVPGGPGMGPGMGWGRNPFMQVEDQLKADYPDEMAEIEKLRTDAELKLQALADKADVELPMTPERIRIKLTAQFPDEMAEVEKLRSSDPRSAMQKTMELMQKADIKLLPPGGGMMPPNFPGPAFRDGDQPEKENNARRLNVGRVRNELLKNYPDEMAEIEKLRSSDPASARKKMQELIKRYQDSNSAK